jgi:transcriptional regulator with XRE-family HTH domain
MENKNALKQHFSALGDFLKDKREKKGLSQIDVAKACQCKSQFVSNWERGKCSPPWDILKKLVKICEIPERQIYNFLMKEYEQLIITNLGIKKR